MSFIYFCINFYFKYIHQEELNNNPCSCMEKEVQIADIENQYGHFVYLEYI